MRRTTDAKVLMVGPDLSLRGGIVSVVNGYLDLGIGERCGEFFYQGTGTGPSLVAKCIGFAAALCSYSRLVNRYDIVHLHISAKGSFIRKSIMAGLAARHGKVVVLHEHSGEFARDYEQGTELYRRLIRHTFQRANRVIVLSEEWRDYFAEKICDKQSLFELSNGVRVPPKVCAPAEHQDVLFLGRLDENKSPDVLLRASRKVLLKNPEMRLNFCGDGDIGRYQAIASTLGILDRCVFHGWTDGANKEAILSRTGILCLPSKHEAMPMSVLEAMAHGIPVIATDVGGIPKVIEDGVSGFLMAVDDEKRLAELLDMLAGSAELRASIGKAGRERVTRNFSSATVVNQLIALYDDMYMEVAL